MKSIRTLLLSSAATILVVAAAALDRPYFYSTATALYTGSVLILGGYDDKGETTDRAWLFRK